MRSSWLTVDTNSLFMRSMRLRSLMSRTMPTYSGCPCWVISDTASSIGNRLPSRRWPSTSRPMPMMRATPVVW